MVRINRSYDIPYGGGYSIDGQTIYIDRNFTQTFTSAYTGEVHPFIEVLIHHEKAELMFLPGRTYNEAHKLAVESEIIYLRKNNIPIDEYYGALYKEVVHCLERYKAGKSYLPPDLDMRPYHEDKIEGGTNAN